MRRLLGTFSIFRQHSNIATTASPPLMKAAQYTAYGEKTVKIVDVPKPSAKAGELLVKVEAASINPLDWKLQTGGFKWFIPLKFPVIPSCDLSGTVEAVGEGVTSFVVGDRIVAGTHPKDQGALAEFAIVAPPSAAKLPAGVSIKDAAAIPIAGLSALLALKEVGVTFDKSYEGRILIINASGGVGTFAVQMAKLAGAHVVATCGARNMGLLKELGADEVLDYKGKEVTSFSYLSTGSYDAIIHGAHVENLDKLMAALKDGGAIAVLAGSPTRVLQSALNMLNPFAKKKIIPFLLKNIVTSDLETILQWVEDGKLKVIIDSAFPLSRADEAWAKSSDGHATGKIVVTMT